MWHQVGDIAYYHFPSLSAQPNLVNAVFTRHGGVSQGPYASLNASLSVGDDPAAVLENRRRTAAALGLDPRDFVGAGQVHGHRVALVVGKDGPQPIPGHREALVVGKGGPHTIPGDREALVVGKDRPHPIPDPSPLRLRQRGEESASSPSPTTLERGPGGEASAMGAVIVHNHADGDDDPPAMAGVDALITSCPGAMLAMRFADCVPVLLYDPIHEAVGLAHAGWRGSAASIAGRTVRAMTQAFDTRPQDLLAGVGPSIGQCCYEVGHPVIQHFSAHFPWWREVVADGAGKFHLDLWETNRRQLLDAGLPAEQIAVAGICTACHTEDFYSHRLEHTQEAGVTGRFTAVIGMRA